MQTLNRPSQERPLKTGPMGRRNKRFSPVTLIGIAITLLVVIGAGIFFVVQPRMGTHAADANANCALIVPQNPLSAQGLATPYELKAQNNKNGPCNESNDAQTAFVQAAIVDPATGKVSIYSPLVIDRGTRPAVTPTPPNLPNNAIVGIWFGFNGDTLELLDHNGSLRQGKCVNGADNSVFGQFAYCNAPAFFQAANKAIQAGQLKPPALGTAKDGMPCPTVRDFSVVDQDQSDNLPTSYLVTRDGRTAQLTAANSNKLSNAQVLTNGSDNRLLDISIDSALGCSPWTAPDLADPGQMVASLAMNELQAAALQPAPVAIVPAGDPMVLDGDGNIDLNKTNAYRLGVDQQPAQSKNDADTSLYCKQMLNVGLPRIIKDAPLTVNIETPDAGAGTNLFTFLGQRFVASFGQDNLNCTKLLHMNDPLSVVTNNDGAATKVKLNGKTINPDQMGGGTNNGGGNQGNAAPNCNLNGKTIQNCTGTTTINGQSCTVSFADNTVTLKCQNAPGNGGDNNGGDHNGDHYHNN